ncbi:hypothetical protein PUNSTDRAFT_62494, partial [Punctularia strigosozonata HHB-11173 SS5]|uniref:uncharacterized protein n=1 Tax=Punctularia strigosozonata (strain HHB-11173) TaxID=741275 RepID=UPI0004417325
VDEETITKLESIFSESLLLAALDLIDCEGVIKYTTPWGRVHYEAVCSQGTYLVHPKLGSDSTLGFYCPCPAFTYTVLVAGSHPMCKHVLAIRLAERLDKCVERQLGLDGLAFIIARQFG